jgi:hypothetical protein
VYYYKVISSFSDDELEKFILYSGKYSRVGWSRRAAATPERLQLPQKF